MKKDAEELKEKMQKETEKIWLKEPVDVKKMRLGLYGTAAGSYNQYFSVYDLTLHYVGCFVSYVYPAVIRVAKDSKFDIYHLRTIVRTILKNSMFCYGHLGWVKIGEFNSAFLDMLDDLSREDFVELLELLTVYMRQHYAWQYHYHPWAVGAFFQKRSEKDIKEMAELL
jgi:hypothetical protein